MSDYTQAEFDERLKKAVENCRRGAGFMVELADAINAFIAECKAQPAPAATPATPTLVWEVNILGGTMNPVAAFQYQDQALEWSVREYPGRTTVSRRPAPPAPAVTPERLRYLEACEKEADAWRNWYAATPGYLSFHEGCVREARTARDAARKDVP